MLATSLADAVVNDEVATTEGIEAHLKEYSPEEIVAEIGEEDLADIALRIGNRLDISVREEVLERTYDDGEALGQGDCELCEREMPLTAHHLIPRETHRKYRKKGMTQEELNLTTKICRPCHSAIHRTYDNQTLGAHFNTVEKLLGDEAILKFVKWAAKQRPTNTDMAMNGTAKYRR